MEENIKAGPVAAMGVTQTMDGRLKLNISVGKAVDAPKLINENTYTQFC